MRALGCGCAPCGGREKTVEVGGSPLFIYSKFFAKDWSNSDRAVIVEVVQIVLCSLDTDGDRVPIVHLSYSPRLTSCRDCMTRTTFVVEFALYQTMPTMIFVCVVQRSCFHRMYRSVIVGYSSKVRPTFVTRAIRCWSP